jgi:hypothetical protein
LFYEIHFKFNTTIIFGNVYAQSDTAIVNKVQGLYIFTDNTPVQDYKVIGEVNSSGASQTDNDVRLSMSQYQPIRDFLIRKARLANPNADGLLLTLVNGGTDKAVLIKFTNQDVNNALAIVQSIRGVLIFSDAKPKSKYNYLETIMLKRVKRSYQYTSIRDQLIEKSKKEYPDLRAVIISMVFGAKDTADIIRF